MVFDQRRENSCVTLYEWLKAPDDLHWICLAAEKGWITRDKAVELVKMEGAAEGAVLDQKLLSREQIDALRRESKT